MQKILEIENLSVNYPVSSGLFNETKEYIHALNHVSLDIYKGEVLGLVGESGCGKSTLGKAVLRLITPEGRVLFENKNIMDFDKKEIKAFRKNAQLIFQNPFSSLNPRMTIKEILREPLVVHGIRDKKIIDEKIKNILNMTGLNEETLTRYPHEFSGGQRQRIAIARALILRPEFLVADEPVSALDVSIQAQIVKLLLELKEKKAPQKGYFIFSYQNTYLSEKVIRNQSLCALVAEHGKFGDGRLRKIYSRLTAK